MEIDADLAAVLDDVIRAVERIAVVCRDRWGDAGAEGALEALARARRSLARAGAKHAA